jgi:RNA polymerase sigma factor (sigma-70 family)
MDSKPLYGEELKRSNESILKEYDNLVKWWVGRYTTKFQLNTEESMDLYQSLIAKLFAAPRSYRNPGGIKTIIRTQIRDLIRFIIKHDNNIQMGSCREGDEYEDGSPVFFHEPTPVPPPNNNGLDFELLQKYLPRLTSAERSVLGMFYGIDGHQVFSVNSIARKLGKDKSWVYRTQQKAILSLQKQMKLKQTLVGL